MRIRHIRVLSLSFRRPILYVHINNYRTPSENHMFHRIRDNSIEVLVLRITCTKVIFGDNFIGLNEKKKICVPTNTLHLLASHINAFRHTQGQVH